MDQLRAMRLFVRVVDEGSFAAAARALELAPAGVTRQIAELEAHLGVRLLNRNTRRIALTDIGEAYVERARVVLADLDDADALASASVKDARGHVRVLAPPALAVHQLAKHLPEFHRRFPLVTLDLEAAGPVETVDEDHDVTLIWTGKALDGDFVVRRLARSEVILCAAPDYLDRRGRPAHPDQLVDFDALMPPLSDVMRSRGLQRAARDGAQAGKLSTVTAGHPPSPAPLAAQALASARPGRGQPPAHASPEFELDSLLPRPCDVAGGMTFQRDVPDSDGRSELVTVVPSRSVLSTSHVDTKYAAALAGLGIAALPSMVIEDALLQHVLERVLPEWRLFSADVWAAMPSRKHLPARTRVFVDFLVEMFGGQDRDPWLAAAGCATVARTAPWPVPGGRDADPAAQKV